MFWTYLKEIWRGKDLYRILMNSECANFELRGLVLDVGSGEGASYNRFFKKQPGVRIVPLDLKTGIDLEKDRLPYGDAGADFVLAFNLLEHIYNYQHLLFEIKRVLKPGGQLIGAVPFLVGYHPDPHDYWRYTSEALRKILSVSGLIVDRFQVLGRGPLSLGFSSIEFMLPRWLKLIKLPFVLAGDWLIWRSRPKWNLERFALGLFFTATKK